jgi:predicted SprT family Zn-dependent metalloprotease
MTLRQRINQILDDLKQRHPEYAEEISRIVVRTSSRMTAAAGKASWRGPSRILSISSVFFSDPANVESNLFNTVTHEVAHLLCPRGAGHGPIWRAMHRRLGGTGERCHTMERQGPVRRKSRHDLHCVRCREVVTCGPTIYKRVLRGTRYTHRGCGGRLDVNPGFGDLFGI